MRVFLEVILNSLTGPASPADYFFFRLRDLLVIQLFFFLLKVCKVVFSHHDLDVLSVILVVLLVEKVPVRLLKLKLRFFVTVLQLAQVNAFCHGFRLLFFDYLAQRRVLRRLLLNELLKHLFHVDFFCLVRILFVFFVFEFHASLELFLFV